MKEHTFVVDVQLTSICLPGEGDEVLPKDEIAKNIKAALEYLEVFDDILVKEVQIFERDVDPDEVANE